MRESIRRSFLWSAYGDALGFITERRGNAFRGGQGERPKINSLIPWSRRVGGRFGVNIRLPAGCYSDDTQLRLATSRSIRGSGAFDVEAFSKVELPIWLSYALGAGRGTRAAAESLKKQQIQWNWNFHTSGNVLYLNGGGNGGAMRIQPHVWCAGQKKETAEILRDVIRNTITTHGHSRAIVGATFHALCLRRAISSQRIPDLSDWHSILEELSGVPDIVRSDEDLLFHWLPSWEKETGRHFQDSILESLGELREDIGAAEKILEGNGGYDRGVAYGELARGIGGLQSATVGSAPKTALLAAFLSHIFRNSPHEGIVEATNLIGSDTDTISTMAGAILGATAETDPPEKVSDIEYLERESQRLWQISEGQRTTNHAYPDLLYWKPPVSQIDALGRQAGNLVLQGFGQAKPIGNPVEKGGKAPVAWQWFELEFGQTVLLTKRPVPNALTKDVVPSEPKTPGSEALSTPREEAPQSTSTSPTSDQARLWDRGDSFQVRNGEGVTIESAANRAISSGFREDVVGSMLMKLAEQENGIDHSVAFAAIVARAKRARLKGEREAKS